MFLKPFRVKSRNLIKGSDRKKLRNEISQQWTSLQEEDWKTCVPTKDEMEVMKIYCHSGQIANVFFLEKLPSFLEIEKVIYPTVYTLWKYPNMLPVFTTWPQVFKKLKNGAELMLPGLADAVIAENLPKNSICSVCLKGNKSPVAVGVTLLSTSDMVESGLQGKGVRIIHIFEDYLWAEGDKSAPPLLVDSLECISPEVQNEEDKMNSSSQDGLCDADSLPEVNLSSDKSESKNSLDNLNDDDSLTPELLSSDNMNSLLEWCLLCALKYKITKSDIPISTSDFYTRFMQPCCPESKSLDIKQSTYKKLSKFLQEYASRKMITLKELSKGVESIIDINKSHPEYRSFEVESNTLEEIEKKILLKEGSEDIIHEPPKIREMLAVVGNISNFFKGIGYCKGSFLSSQDLKKSVTEYVNFHELQSPQDGRVVILDAHLADATLSKGEYMETMTWPLLLMRLEEKLQPAYEICFPNKEPELKKGKLRPISMNIVQRSGNKKVTLIENLEIYGIDPSKFAHEVQVAISCSASAQPLPGNKSGFQVVIQGNQIGYVTRILTETFQLPRKYLQGAEKALKKR